MKRENLLLVYTSFLGFIFPSIAFAQNVRDGEAEQACAACAGMGGVFIFIIILAIVINIALLVWVARDAKARGMDSSVLWMILVMVIGLLGLIIYLFSRPQGNLIQCAQCGNKRLQASAKCPHCGNA